MPTPRRLIALTIAATFGLSACGGGGDLGDLGGLFDGGFAEDWIQQATLAVGARGTVAAAFTEIAAAGSAQGEKPRTFIVEQPYVFRVIDTRTGWPLLLATVSDPGQES